MKKISINNQIVSFKKTLVRFPVTILSAILATLLSIYIIEIQYEVDNIQKYFYLLHVLILAIPLFIASTIISELKNFNILKKILIKIIVIILLVTYYFILPEHYTTKVLYRGILLTIFIHLFISYLPFLRKGRFFNFWHYNRQLLKRIAITALYSAVIFVGIAIAILTISLLFSIDIDEEIYLHLWIFIVGIFSTIFFLANFPKDFNKTEHSQDTIKYPLSLKIFTQFVLLPLIILYLLILYWYMFKVIISAQIPEGINSYLIIIFSILGIFSLLLIYPVQNSEKYKWIKIYSKIFYWAIFPLIILLFTAIFIRIKEYGITENRYFILALAFWLVGISVFLLINKLKNIKLIPISLSILTLIAAFGPWSAFSISKHSQINRLETILRKIKL